MNLTNDLKSLLMKFTNIQFVRYLMVGVVNIVITYLLYLLFLIFLPYQMAFSGSYLCGIFLSYYLNSTFVFRQPLAWRKALQYPLVYLVQYLLGLAVLSLLVETLHLDPRLGAIFNTLITLPITFVLSRLIIGQKTAPYPVQSEG